MISLPLILDLMIIMLQEYSLTKNNYGPFGAKIILDFHRLYNRYYNLNKKNSTLEEHLGV